MEPAVARNMLKGLPDTLHSEFRLSYSMLLNLMRGEGRMPARELLAASFKQFQVEQALPALKLRVEKLQVRTSSGHTKTIKPEWLSGFACLFAKDSDEVTRRMDLQKCLAATAFACAETAMEAKTF